MSYNVLASEQATEYIKALDDKSKRIIKDNLEKLREDPYPRPGTGSGDKEKIMVQGEELYRLHIGRTHTAFYDIIEKENQVNILEILPIDEAHEKYGYG